MGLGSMLQLIPDKDACLYWGEPHLGFHVLQLISQHILHCFKCLQKLSHDILALHDILQCLLHHALICKSWNSCVGKICIMTSAAAIKQCACIYCWQQHYAAKQLCRASALDTSTKQPSTLTQNSDARGLLSGYTYQCFTSCLHHLHPPWVFIVIAALT